jgi:hypothetical protein
MQDLLPESDFRLFAFAVRFPTGLAGQVIRLKAGVYDATHFSGTLRIVVVHQLPEEEHSAMLTCSVPVPSRSVMVSSIAGNAWKKRALCC